MFLLSEIAPGVFDMVDWLIRQSQTHRVPEADYRWIIGRRSIKRNSANKVVHKKSKSITYLSKITHPHHSISNYKTSYLTYFRETNTYPQYIYIFTFYFRIYIFISAFLRTAIPGISLHIAHKPLQKAILISIFSRELTTVFRLIILVYIRLISSNSKLNHTYQHLFINDHPRLLSNQRLYPHSFNQRDRLCRSRSYSSDPLSSAYI